MRITTSAAAAAMAALALLSGGQAAAATYNPFTAFDVTTGVLTFPNFAVGAFDGSVFQPAGIIADDGYGTGVDVAWYSTYGGAYKNVTGSEFQAGTVLFETDRLNLHPGSNHDVALAFIAPSAGEFRFVGQFSVQDTSPSGVSIAAVAQSGPAIFASSFNAAGQTYDFDFKRTLTAGERVYFAVGRQLSYGSDSTGILLNVSDVSAAPEPTSWALMIAGFGGAGVMLRQRRRGVVRPA